MVKGHGLHAEMRSFAKQKTTNGQRTVIQGFTQTASHVDGKANKMGAWPCFYRLFKLTLQVVLIIKGKR